MPLHMVELSPSNTPTKSARSAHVFVHALTAEVMDKALMLGAPMIGLNDSGGARIQV